MRHACERCSRRAGSWSAASSGLANANNIAIADADEERGVDQAGEQEHAALQHRHELRLAGSRLEELRAHDADAECRRRARRGR